MNIITLLQSDDFFYLNVFLKLLLGLLAIILIINKSGKGNFLHLQWIKYKTMYSGELSVG